MEIHHPSIVFSSPEESVPSPPQESIPTTQKSILTTPAPLPPASNTSNEESKYLSTYSQILIFIAELLKVAQINYVSRNQLHCTANLNFGLMCKKAKHCWALPTNFLILLS
jgi:hypothetical protein